MALAALAGALHGACFAPLAVWPLGFVALAPLVAATRGRRAAAGLGLGWVAGTIAPAIAVVPWVAAATHDYFTHPLRESVHAEVVQQFFMDLWDKGAFRIRELPAFWCAKCARFLYEAEIRGACQFCSAPSDGLYCEGCGRPQESGGLLRGHCTHCGTENPTQASADVRTNPGIVLLYATSGGSPYVISFFIVLFL